MEGQVLGNRYELVEKIGGGGMALVYKAKCNLLNRFVAVKVLRSEFTNDEEFVKRFRIEAQAAASLSHPNIVSIYDVGHEESAQYIVMEYIDGVTLKEYISQRGALPWKEAVNITIQICSAIEHAHRNRIVHRDIKPHNILMTKDGIAKVTDFGIARAVSSSTITMVGSTIGSVHYFSPEQARGGFTDEKSDLYSLGIALYEMVTGSLPFDGDTPVAIALKHMQTEPIAPREVNNDIPLGVNNIIMKAIKKDQNNRYQTASEMLEDLYRVLKEPEGSFVSMEDVESFPTRRMEAVSAENTKVQNEAAVVDHKGDQSGKKTDKVVIWLAVTSGLVIVAVLLFLVYNFLGPSPGQGNKENEIEIRDYVDLDIDIAKEELEKEGITVDVSRRNDEKKEKDLVISQKPVGGTKIKKGGIPVQFIVSDGPELIDIPDISKAEYRTAETKLINMGLLPKIEEEFSEIPIGFVTRTVPAAGEKLKAGDSIIIYRSKGPEIKKTKVPSLTNLTKIEAQRLLVEYKLKLGKITPEGGKPYTDKVISQYPDAGVEVDEGSPVDITFEEVKDRQEEIELVLGENADQYGDQINVRVEIKRSDTNKVENIYTSTHKKEDFPLKISIPIPMNGKTSIKTYYNEEIVDDSTLYF
ncbi:MAG: Stk1 family PASTA domain-containing Ser/Thr kinase [Clostridia bacterium]|nr:Stk1 family PASTA domain-containing Ser/Thr kinase [Clostridia bacterium]